MLRSVSVRRLLPLILGSLVVLCATTRAFAAPGDLDPSFMPIIVNDYGAPKVLAIVVQPDGKILIGGQFTQVGGQPRVGIARLNADGTVDPTFAAGLRYANAINTIELNPDGNLFIGGNFDWSPDVATIRELALLGSSGQLLKDFDLRSPNFLSYSNQIFDIVVEPTGAILVGGQFGYLSNQYVAGLARLGAGGTVEPLGVSAGLTNPMNTSLQVRSIVRQPDGQLLVGGQFVATGNRQDLIRTFPDGNVDGTFLNMGTANGTADQVNTIVAQPNGQFLVAGTFGSLGGTNAARLARLNPDGTVDQNHEPLSLGFAGGALSMRLQGDGKILLGGQFDNVNGSMRNGIMRLTASFGVDAFYPNPSGINGEVWAIDVDAEGRVLAGGFFTQVAGVSRPTLARLLDESVPNTAPQLSGISATPASLNENGSITLSGTITEPDAGDTVALTVNWGDGSTPTVTSYGSGTSTISLTHQYLDDGPTGTAGDLQTIGLSIEDGNGGSDTDSTSVTVNNVAPSLTNVAIAPTAITAGSSATLSGTIGDTGTLDPHTVVINWGDGTTNTTLNLLAAVTSFSADHQFATAGSFTIGVTLTDDDLGQATGSAGITVNPLPAKPAAPTALNAIVTSTRVGKKTVYSGALTWTDNANNETAFVVQRFTAGKKNSCVADNSFGTIVIAANGTSYTDAKATASVCGYQVSARNAQGDSAPVRDLNVGPGVTP